MAESRLPTQTSLFTWCLPGRGNAWLLATLGMAALCLVLAFGVLHVTHQTREHYGELQRLTDQYRELQTRWGQLLLEESSWSSPARIEQIADQKLGMHIPDVNEVEVIQP